MWLYIVSLMLCAALGAFFPWLLRIGYKEKTGKEPSIKRFLLYFFAGCLVALALFNGTLFLLQLFAELNWATGIISTGLLAWSIWGFVRIFRN